MAFHDADILGVAWHGRFPVYFELGSSELGRRCGLSYREFREAKLLAPIAQIHVDYHRPLLLDETFTIQASLLWNDGARMNTEFMLIKKDQTVAATGYTVQMFVDGPSWEVCLVAPELWERCRRRWKAGEFECIQNGPSS